MEQICCITLIISSQAHREVIKYRMPRFEINSILQKQARTGYQARPTQLELEVIAHL